MIFNNYQQKQIKMKNRFLNQFIENGGLPADFIQKDDVNSQLAAFEQLAASLKGLKPSFSLTPEYIEFTDKGQFLDCFFMGFQTMTTKKGEIEAVKVLGETGLKLNAGSSLVKILKEAKLPVQTPIRIIFRDEEKTNNGNTVKIFDVKLMK